MRDIILTESQFKLIVETGSNSAAMDLDIYVQPVDYDTSNGNDNLENSLDEISFKLKELTSMLDSGKKINFSVKNRIFQVVDELNQIYEIIKFD